MFEATGFVLHRQIGKNKIGSTQDGAHEALEAGASWRLISYPVL